MGKPIDMTGKKIGSLTVLRWSPRPDSAKHTRLMWECLCDCGRSVVIMGKNLRNGMTRSCGCARLAATRLSRRKAPGESGLRELWHAYRISALNRGLNFELGMDDFRSLTSGTCHYCGNSPSTIRWARKSTTPEGKSHSTYMANGVDRVDNAKGYISGNCVPCCKMCNYAKRCTSVENFIDWAYRLVAHQDQKREDGDGSYITW